MPNYFYKAVDSTGRPTSGEIVAKDRAEAATLLSKQGLLPITVKEKTIGTRAAGFLERYINAVPLLGGVSTIEKILFARHLSAILRAGLSLSEALEIMQADAQREAMRKILQDAKSSVEQGEQLSAVLARYPQHFSLVFVGMVKSGELSGTLESALDSLAQGLMRDDDLKKRVRMAMIYPAILLTGSTGVIILMMTFVLPRMAKAFRGVIHQLPWITRVFIAASSQLSRNPTLTISVFVLLLVAFIYVARSVWGRRLLFRFFERLPISSELIKKLALARFTRTFRNLLASGTGVIEAIEISAKTIGNPIYESSLLAMNEELKRGANLSEGFKARPDLYPRMFASIILVGEKTGTLEKSLETLALFYEEEVDRVLKTLVALLEPILLFIMGIVVAIVALAVLLPIFRAVRILQQ